METVAPTPENAQPSEEPSPDSQRYKDACKYAVGLSEKFLTLSAAGIAFIIGLVFAKGRRVCRLIDSRRSANRISGFWSEYSSWLAIPDECRWKRGGRQRLPHKKQCKAMVLLSSNRYRAVRHRFAGILHFSRNQWLPVTKFGIWGIGLRSKTFNIL